MDALEILGQMHVEAKAAFRKIESAVPGQPGELWAKLRSDLELHEQIEERFVYDPVARDVAGRDEVLAAWEHEHEAQVAHADTAMAHISSLAPEDPRWLDELRALHATLDGHIAHEENDIWPRIRAAWDGAKLDAAGRLIEEAKAAARGTA